MTEIKIEKIKLDTWSVKLDITGVVIEFIFKCFFDVNNFVNSVENAIVIDELNVRDID